MAEHLALQGLKRVRTLLLNATRAEKNVEIGRVTNMTDVDAIDIIVGPDTPQSQYGMTATGRQDMVQRFWIDLHTRTLEHQDKVVEHLFEMRAKCHQLLMADPTLGLPFVISMRQLGTEDFDLMYAGERIGAMRTVWDMAYQMVYADPTV